MKIVKSEITNTNTLVPEDGKWLVMKEEMLEERRNYTQCVYLANGLTLEQAQEVWAEVEKQE